MNKINSFGNEVKEKLRIEILEDIYKKQEKIIERKSEKINFLENQIIKIKKDTVPLKMLKKELAVQYPEIEKFAFARSIELNNPAQYDTFPVIMVKWKRGYQNSYIRKKSKTLQDWLKIRLNLDTLRIVKY